MSVRAALRALFAPEVVAPAPVIPPTRCFCTAFELPAGRLVLRDENNHMHGLTDCEMRRCSCGEAQLSYGAPVTDDDGKTHSLPHCAKPEPAPDFECPDCASVDFTVGGATSRVNRHGARAHGQVLSCIGCGGRWYNTGRGLKRPHEAALPLAWAMADLQGRAAKAAADAQLARESRLRQAQEHSSVSPQRGPTAGFRKPPAPEPS